MLVTLLFTLWAAQAPAPGPRVTISSDGWSLVGNLKLPAGDAPVPAVLMLNGAARDRRAYIVLAQELASRGIASLRLDLRGEGESTNLGRFEPGQQNATLAGEDRDVAAALRWLRSQRRIDGSRVGVLGASYSGESMAVAARAGATASAYVALSPGSFSDESVRAIDPSDRPWWFIASRQERFARSVVEAIPSASRTARVTIVEGTSHASDILSPHTNLNAEIADWFAARLARRAAPRLWGDLDAGAYDVGFSRRETTADGRVLLVDTWYPAQASTALPMTFRSYFELATDLRGVVSGFPTAATSVERSLAVAISGDEAGVDGDALSRILASPMLAGRDVAAAGGRFPVVLWTPRYATTVAQSVMSEYLASHGFVVAFVRPASAPVALPFELTTPEAKRAELAARVADMGAAVKLLDGDPVADTSRIATIAWSYTGELATAFQLAEPRVTLVAGLSTTVLNDWVYAPDDLAKLDASKLTAAYAVLTQRGAEAGAPPAALARAAGATYFVEFPGMAHGSFNALEGSIPSLFGLTRVQRWSRSGPETARGYEAVATMLLRLSRHHVAGGAETRLVPLVLRSAIPEGVAIVR